MVRNTAVFSLSLLETEKKQYLGGGDSLVKINKNMSTINPVYMSTISIITGAFKIMLQRMCAISGVMKKATRN